MAIEVITEFVTKATVRVIAYVYDDDGNLVDPTAVKITIYDPADTKQVDNQDMTKSATGIYEYYYHKGESSDPMDKGQWRGEVVVIDGSGADAIISPENFSFKVR